MLCENISGTIGRFNESSGLVLRQLALLPNQGPDRPNSSRFVSLKPKGDAFEATGKDRLVIQWRLSAMELKTAQRLKG